MWLYLLNAPSPWGGDNRGLITLYRRAAGGECPLVIDKSTPSCGHSRFGCWTCTVVGSDRSTEALVELGEEQLVPLLEFRDYLKRVRDMPGARQDTRRNGRPALNREGEPMTGTGPFTHRTRQDLLRRLLSAQRASGFTLIEGDELAAIQEIWSLEEGNPQPVDAVRRIWIEMFEEETMAGQANGTDNHLSKEDVLLQQVCEAQGVSFELMRRLRDIEEEYGHLKRRQGLPDDMREAVQRAVAEEQER